MVGNVENPCFQKSSRSSTAANWSWICNPRGRGTEFIHSSFLSPPFLYLTNPAHPVSSNKMVQTYDQQRGVIPLSSNCPWWTLLQRITINGESNNDYSARLTSVGFQTKTSFCNCCPPSLNQEKEDDHEANYQETSTSFPESIRVQHQPGNSSFQNSFFIA